MKPFEPSRVTLSVAAALLGGMVTTNTLAVPLPGGTLDPLTIPKYVSPLIIPPVMPRSPAFRGQAGGRGCTAIDAIDPTNRCQANYRIALRQFSQQVLPAGFPTTLLWGYGSIDAPGTVAQGGTFNNPSFTIEATRNAPTSVIWLNQLVANPDACYVLSGRNNVRNARAFAANPACNFVPHILPVDQTLHWAAPNGPVVGCRTGVPRTDCRGVSGAPYLGPVPMVTHVHGAEVGPESDGYPEAWYLPWSNNIPAGYGTEGTRYGDTTAGVTFRGRGAAFFSYPNTQPSATLWYHDHSLGITRNNVNAAAAGFYIVREPGGGESGLVSGVLPGPAPRAGDATLALNTPGNPVRSALREVPIAIQERSFNADGSIFYPDNRAFFEGLTPAQLQIPFLPDPASDISPIWNPEFFGNTFVVNGQTWPRLEVASERYRLRLINANDSRFLNLSLRVVNADGTLGAELPFYQIGAEQSLLPKVVKVQTGCAIALPGDGTDPACPATPTGDPSVDDRALLLGNAERPDVIVDFGGLANGTVVRMINTGPDEPFGGFPVGLVADPGTTGQVMQFVVNTALNNPGGDPSTPPAALVLSKPDPLPGPATVTRILALGEEESALLCVDVDPTGNIVVVQGSTPPACAAGGVPFAPKAAVLGTIDQATGNFVVQLWDDPITTNPPIGATEIWEIYNVSADAHPIHPHLVKHEVVSREVIGSGTPRVPEPTEAGWKDTTIMYPGEVTRIRMQFPRGGLYVWHCHIISHEDNEMMVPFCVGTVGVDCPAGI
jgi:FtsP/CotA-like multicopper oxidase with cupredoxin domain